MPSLHRRVDPEVQTIPKCPAEMKMDPKWQLTTPQARCGAIRAIRAQSWLTTGANSTVKVGTGLPLLGVLSSRRISRYFALPEVGKVKRELPTLGGSTPDFMIV